MVRSAIQRKIRSRPDRSEIQSPSSAKPRRGWPEIPSSSAELAAHTSATHSLIEKEVARLTTHLAQYETIKRFALLRRRFHLRLSGSLTFTNENSSAAVVEQQYSDVIDKLYADRSRTPAPVLLD